MNHFLFHANAVRKIQIKNADTDKNTDEEDIYKEMIGFTKKLINSVSNLQWQIRKQRDLIDQKENSRYVKQNYLAATDWEHDDF